MPSEKVRFSPATHAALVELGWYPGRDMGIQVNHWKATLERVGFRLFQEAEVALREFGGIHSTISGRGLECAREPFQIDPLLAQHDNDLFAEPTRILGVEIFPLGEVAGGHTFLAIAEDGRVFMFMEDLWLVGATMDEGLEALLLGKKKQLIAADIPS